MSRLSMQFYKTFSDEFWKINMLFSHQGKHFFKQSLTAFSKLFAKISYPRIETT